MSEGEAEGRKCDVDGCGRVHQARGLCMRHYQRARAAGRLPADGRTEGEGPVVAEGEVEGVDAGLMFALEGLCRNVRRLLRAEVSQEVRRLMGEVTVVAPTCEEMRGGGVADLEAAAEGVLNGGGEEARERLERALRARGRLGGVLKGRGMGSRGGDFQSLERGERTASP